MKLIETKITENAAYIRYADSEVTPESWIDIQVPLKDLKNPWDEQQPLGNIETRLVAEARLATLRVAREIIGAEIQRLSDRSNLRRG
jgi:hypothetical protein